MNRERILEALREHAAELRATGVTSMSLFGSTARGDEHPADVDVALRLSESFSNGGFDYFYRLEQLGKHLSELLGCKVDVVPEPLRKERFQREIDRDRILAF